VIKLARSVSELDIPAGIQKDIDFVVSTLLEKFVSNIDKIILFGSYATGKYQPDSDIDIAVSLNELPDKTQRRAYKQAVDIERDVDLLFCSKEQLSSNAFVYRHVNESGVVLYEQL
jgi:predicted nucleotidyltransferase